MVLTTILNKPHGVTPMLEIFVDLLGLITSIPSMLLLLTMPEMLPSTSGLPSIKVPMMKLGLSPTSPLPTSMT